MINKSRLKDVLTKYKQGFVSKEWSWANEKYKWEAIKHFQNNWNIDAKDFAAMLHNSLDKTKNLLSSYMNYPRQMIETFAEKAPEEVRDMFKTLFDESKDVCDRIKEFKDKAEILHKKYGEKDKQHYQRESPISIYLWLRYPEKYYIYKFGEVEKVAKKLNSDYTFKRGDYENNISNTAKLYDEICNELKLDTELVNLLRSRLTDTYYSDPNLKILTIGVAFYISRYYKQENASSVK